MVFSSILFLLYFLPIFLFFYFLSPQRWKNEVALLGSCFFYSWGAPEFFFVVLTSLLLDFYLVHLFSNAKGKLRIRLFYVAVISNVVILLAAKYLNFFVGNVNELLNIFAGTSFTWRNILLPIGVSFITFQKLSYVFDCYRGTAQPMQRLRDYMLYILLFPQLIAGPIVRFNEVAAQIIYRSHQDTIDYKLSGIFRFIIGLSKKVLIANVLGGVVDEIFRLPPSDIPTGLAWLGIIAYSLQIYFDFSGYSDMAIGLAKILGFRFPENFNFPYISQSITEFWRRWHITLSSWMRDYLYIPLGGNRVSQRRLYINLWTVFLISGFWHGAAWTFVVWGAFHGLFLILDRLFLINFLERVGKLPAIMITYGIVLLGWVFFRCENLGDALQYLYQMFAFDFSKTGIFIPNKFYVLLTVGLGLVFLGYFEIVQKRAVSWYEDVASSGSWTLLVKSTVTVFLGWWCLIEIFGSDFNPFIYFKF
ncbi:MAG: MBOAT family O-acyltransferase [Bacteroidota bacterium]